VQYAVTVCSYSKVCNYSTIILYLQMNEIMHHKRKALKHVYYALHNNKLEWKLTVGRFIVQIMLQIPTYSM
jgi:hypothetical protein